MTEKILIVDDDNEFREEFKYGLEGYDVLEAGSGEEAIKRSTSLFLTKKCRVSTGPRCLNS